MPNTDRTRMSADETKQAWRSGPSEEEQSAPMGDSTADTQSIDLNHATWQQLMGVEGMDEAHARKIVEHRTHLGHFQTWEDFARVDGMDVELVHAVQHAARIGGIESQTGTPRPPQSTEPSKKP
jgi:DNA uptake protein ComE-like DNA-binding protein